MISDEQGKKWLLQKLYDDGWRYCVMDNFDNLYLTNEKPSMFDDVDEIRISSCKKAMGVSAFKNVLPKLKCNEYISIAEELGIVNWSEVPVDTPIYIRAHESNTWEKRHFAYFKDGKVYAWLNSATSWTVENPEYVFSWKNAKLAEV